MSLLAGASASAVWQFAHLEEGFVPEEKRPRGPYSADQVGTHTLCSSLRKHPQFKLQSVFSLDCLGILIWNKKEAHFCGILPHYINKASKVTTQIGFIMILDPKYFLNKLMPLDIQLLLFVLGTMSQVTHNYYLCFRDNATGHMQLLLCVSGTMPPVTYNYNCVFPGQCHQSHTTLTVCFRVTATGHIQLLLCVSGTMAQVTYNFNCVV